MRLAPVSKIFALVLVVALVTVAQCPDAALLLIDCEVVEKLSIDMSNNTGLC